MAAKPHSIEVDEATAAALRTRATQLGLSVSELVAELVDLEREPITVEPDEIVELDRRWHAVQSGRTTIPHDEVVRWLRTWGTPAFKPWRER